MRVRAAARPHRAWTRRCPVLVLSGRGEEIDRIRGFDRGADDYVVKPFSYPELRRRVEALLRRSLERVPAGVLRVGGAGDRPGEPRRARRRASTRRCRRRSSRCCWRSRPSR